MRKIKGRLGVLLFGLVGLVNMSQAALIDLGNGMVTDDTPFLGTTTGRTWMQDANLFKTLCDTNINDPIMMSYDSLVPVTDAATACAMNGAIDWNDAEKFIAALNSNNYLGGGWRQPATAQPDATCSQQIPAAGVFPAQGYGFNCTNVGSELNHLFYTSLANPNDLDDNCFNPPATDPNHCFQNTAPFSNTQFFVYWSGSEYSPDTTGAWIFNTLIGRQ